MSVIVTVCWIELNNQTCIGEHFFWSVFCIQTCSKHISIRWIVQIGAIFSQRSELLTILCIIIFEDYNSIFPIGSIGCYSDSNVTITTKITSSIIMKRVFYHICIVRRCKYNASTIWILCTVKRKNNEWIQPRTNCYCPIFVQDSLFYCLYCTCWWVTILLSNKYQTTQPYWTLNHQLYICLHYK